VKITRSTRNTAISIVLRGNQDLTERKTQRIIEAIKYITEMTKDADQAELDSTGGLLSVAPKTVMLD
jgi:hypothetical protein